jgi:hypothetical protein
MDKDFRLIASAVLLAVLVDFLLWLAGFLDILTFA